MKDGLRVLLLIFWVLLLYGCSSPPADNHYNTREINEDLPEQVIFFIGDGMGVAHVTAAQIVNNGVLNMTSFPVAGMYTTHCADRAVTESAASATAMVSGRKTNYKMLGVNRSGEAIKNIFEYFHERDYATGIITTSYIQDATPAAFYAHAQSREEKADIALQMMDSGVDVLIGGGSYWMNEREDGRDLIAEMQAEGYVFYDAVEDAPLEGSGKLLVITDQHRMPGINEGREDRLRKAVALAIARLDKTGRPFFLMVENEHIDLYSHENDISNTVDEVLDLDLAVGHAMQYAAANPQTLIVVGADHECGGLTVTGGDAMNGVLEVDWQGDNHTACMVPCYASGPGEGYFSGSYDNTTLFYSFLSLFQIHQQKETLSE